MTSLSGPFVLEKTNTDRLVVGTDDVLHTIYVQGDRPGSTPSIRYTISSDRGLSWSPPVTLASGTSPTLAVDGNGNLGLAFVGSPYGPAGSPQSGAIYYLSKTPNGGWSATSKVVDSGAMPTLAGYGSNMHLAWVSHPVKYHTFPTLTPPAVPLNILQGEDIQLVLLCGIHQWDVPSIAVAPRDAAGTLPPIVRVALYQSSDLRSFCGGYLTAGVAIYERPQNPLPLQPWTLVLQDLNETNDPAFTNYGRVSVSLTANRISSNFYAFYSDVWNGDRVRLARITSAGSRAIHDFVAVTGGLRALTDINALGAPNGDSVKIGYSPIASSYNSTWVRTLTWTSIASTPTLGTAKLLSNKGRNANVVYFERATTGGTQGLNAIFEVESATATYSLQNDYFKPLPGVSCSDLADTVCRTPGATRECRNEFGELGTCQCLGSGRLSTWSCFLYL
ncbi:MAG: hypothetical protein SF066_18345 [Thermoanaerobaculia bacterium]|nr:hypothetical protein [Thermoanaerobaculia bacterium]